MGTRKTRAVGLDDATWKWTQQEAARRSEGGARISAADVVTVALRRLQADVARGETVPGLPEPGE